MSRRRTQYVVDRAYQWRVVTRLFLVIFAVAGLSGLLAFSLLSKTLYRPGEGLSTALIIALIAVSGTLLIELILAIPLIVFLGIRQSHRIAGPISRITRTLAAIGAGDFTQRIRLRRGDTLAGLAASVNQMAERLERRFPTAPRP